MNYIRTWRDKLAPISHTSTFRSTGQITPEEFVLAGDYLVYKFPTWSWADAPPAKRVPYLPEGKQFLVTRGVPCHRRLDENFAGDAGKEDVMIKDGLGSGDGKEGEDEDYGWLNTGGGGGGGGGSEPVTMGSEARIKDVRTVDEAGNVGEKEEEEEEEEIPDMEDEEDDEEAIIRDEIRQSTKAPLAYICPVIYPHIVGDYKDKTVTLEDFPFYDGGVKMASVHPCKHASVMKILLDRADAALKIRRQKLKRANAAGEPAKVESGLKGLVDDTAQLNISGGGNRAGNPPSGQNAGDEWEVLQPEGSEEDEDDQQVAIRVDQYLVVFLKFIASVTPGIEHDFTMGV
ncbi:hypothetical protein CIHG_08451 [Coccidioides immitis H538.4]|uniref:Autophagy-related protein 3 n=1 Tax=Coccidioides immitis H538.4 TaxID=396776 RepID=A0A0J8RZQ9_COCIT|nr:hypothetical protein CIHG_08451 [Coccidioides immitis H538.4]